MINEEFNYLIKHYWNLLKEEEKKCVLNEIVEQKNSQNTKIDSDFEQNLVERLKNENNDIIYFNYCSICGELARTPTSKVCRNGHRKINNIWIR